MVKISSFQGITPAIQFISQVPTQTYSNYSESDIESEIKRNPYSFLNIITNQHVNKQQDKLHEIRRKINDFKSRKILIKNKEKSLYIYRQTNMNDTYIGLICSISLKDYANHKIKAHEKTIINRELLFTEYLKRTKIYAEPVLITHNGSLNSIYKEYTHNESMKTYDFYTKDKIRHEIWEIKEKNKIKSIVKFFEKIDSLYIADGHHRLASSLRNNKNQMCLAYIVAKNELKTLPFHRKITNIKHPDKLLMEMKSLFNVTVIEKPKKNNNNTIQFYICQQWYQINLTQNKKEELIEDLLVSKLLNKILSPIFNILDERKDKNVHFIAGNTNIKEEINNLNKNDCFFFMNAISINTIIQIANQKKTTPPKSTFILPKLASGLIMMEL